MSTFLDYFVGRAIQNTKEKRKRKSLLGLSLLGNLGILLYFKYYNFLAENLQVLVDLVNPNYSIAPHSWLLPVGISFYTFQTLSYTIDVYYKKQVAETNLANFALYVSFFPQLVAGPIERSTNLLSQFRVKHSLDYQRISDGLKLILWGMFKKIVVADRFAVYADQVFSNPDQYTGMPVIMGTILFSFQIYCDFSGYSDIAIGSSKILGIKLMDNFKGPYLSKSIQEFWRRWHISLSTWFRDYLYIPLGGNRGGTLMTYRNLCIVFLVTGIWHGAQWTFIVWGIFHGFFLVIERLGLGNVLKKLPSAIQVFYTFVTASIGWVFFRATSLDNAFLMLKNMFVYNEDFFNLNIYSTPYEMIELQITMFILAIIVILHIVEYKKDFIQFLNERHVVVRWIICLLLFIAIPLLGQYGEHKEFIYFQF